ncbi:MAG: lysophospholipid acyltransferase family protein [Chloroflexota bacterium]
MAPFYYVSNWLLRLILLLLTRWRVTGKENVPRQGPFIIVSNHISTTDSPLIGTAILPRRIVFMAKEELFHFWGTPVIRAYGAFPVRKRQFDRQAIRRAAQVLDKGLALGIYPEGTRSVTRQLQAPYLGAAFIALKYHVPILPVAVIGSERLMTRRLFRRPAVTVRIGKLISPTSFDGKVTKDTLESLSRIFMERIAELLPPAYQGTYGGLT